MNKLTIQKSKFDDEKNKIKAFAQNLPSEIALPSVDTDGALWGLFDHRVTGLELNRLSRQIQNNLIATNQTVSTIIKEFTQIYNTFEVLDKSYIQGIVGSVEEANKASIQALEASDQAKEAIAKANRASNQALMASNQAELSSSQAKTSSKQALKASEQADKASREALRASQDAGLASFKALQASNAAEKASDEALKANKNLAILYQTQAKTIEKLSQFKERFDNLEYIQDLEKTWKDIQNFKKITTSFQIDINEIRNFNEKNIEFQDQKITKQKDEIVAQLNFSSIELNEKIDNFNQLQIKNNQDLKKRADELDLEIKKKTESINEALKEKDHALVKQNKDILAVIENHNLTIISRIETVNEDLNKQKNSFKNLSESLTDFKKEIANELLNFNEKLLDHIDSLTSNLNEKINILQDALLEKEKLFNEQLSHHKLEFEAASLDLTTKITEVQTEISVNQQSSNEKISTLNKELINQREILFKKSDEFILNINSYKQNLYEKELYYREQIVIKNKKLSKIILFSYLGAGFFGAISVTHIVLNILGIF